MYQTATNILNQLTDEQDGSPNPHPFTPIGCLIRVIELHIHTHALSLHVFFYFVFLSLLLSLTLSFCLALSLYPNRHFMQPILHSIIHQTRLNQIFCYLHLPIPPHALLPTRPLTPPFPCTLQNHKTLPKRSHNITYAVT